jgi:hypothetical protein
VEEEAVDNNRARDRIAEAHRLDRDLEERGMRPEAVGMGLEEVDMPPEGEQ